MAEFVYGGDPLLNGKSDAGPLTVASNQGVVASEWNTSQQHDDDLRTAIKSGTYHGLSQSSQAVSASNKSITRLTTTNVLQASVNGAAYKSILEDGLYVRDYGAVGDGSTDDATAIQSAIDAALTQSKALYFDAKTYLINTELSVKGSNLVILGEGISRTTIKAGASVRAVLRLGVDSGESGTEANSTRITGMTIDGNRNATYGLMLLRCGNGYFDTISIGGAKRDGIFLAHRNTNNSVTCVNDFNTFINVNSGSNGTIYGTTEFDDPNDAVADTRHVGYYVAANQFSLQAGTVSRTSGSAVVTGSGTTFLTNGLRSGDPFRIGVSPNTEYGVIYTVDSETQITLTEQLGVTSATQPWSCGAGSGYWEDGHTDNNISIIIGGLFRSNAGFAQAFRGIYGPTVKGCFIDYHRYYAIRVGNASGQFMAGGTVFTSGGGMGPVITSSFEKIYFEAIGKKLFYLGSATNFNCLWPMDESYDTDPYDAAPSVVSGTYTNKHGPHDVVLWETPAVSAGVVNYVPTRVGKDFYNFGTLQLNGVERTYTTHWVVGTTISFTQAVVSLDPVLANRTMTATPHFTALEGQEVTVLNKLGGGGNITFQDESVLPGSNVYLSGSANVTLTPGSTITFTCASGKWYEKGRCIR